MGKDTRRSDDRSSEGSHALLQAFSTLSRASLLFLPIYTVIAVCLLSEGREVKSLPRARVLSARTPAVPAALEVPPSSPYLHLRIDRDGGVCNFTLASAAEEPGSFSVNNVPGVRLEAYAAGTGECVRQVPRAFAARCIQRMCVRAKGVVTHGRGGGGGEENDECLVCTGGEGLPRMCERVYEDLLARSHSLREARAGDRFLAEVTRIAAAVDPPPISVPGATRPTDHKASLDSWKEYMRAVDASQTLSKTLDSPSIWCGKGLVTMAGGTRTLPQALGSIRFVREKFGSTLPAEIWQAAHEVTEYPHEMRMAFEELNVVIRSLPQASTSNTSPSSQLFSLKPAVVLASSFDEVLFIDSDAVLVTDPRNVFTSRRRGGEEGTERDDTAVFWPDHWMMYWDATIFDSIPWPYGDERYGPSQESGIMVVCKSCGGWRPLALAFYMNFHSDVYYPAIYTGHYGEKLCTQGRSDVSCVQGSRNIHTMPGVGDKDTFVLAWAALDMPYRMMRPPAVGGTPAFPGGTVCGSSTLQRSADGSVLLVHHNGNKWLWQDYAQGRWRRDGWGLTHVAAFRDDSQAFLADGQNDFTSVTFNFRMKPALETPPYARWCLILHPPVVVETLKDALGWDVEAELLRAHLVLYSRPWMAEWLDQQSLPAQPGYWSIRTFLALLVCGAILAVVEMAGQPGSGR